MDGVNITMVTQAGAFRSIFNSSHTFLTTYKSEKAKVLVTQSCPTLSDLMDCSPPGSSVHGISQARILEWVAISFCMGSSWPRNGTRVSCIASSLLTIWDGSPNALSYSHTIALQFTPTHLFPHLDLHPLLPEFSQEFPIYLSTSSSLSIQPIFHAI